MIDSYLISATLQCLSVEFRAVNTCASCEMLLLSPSSVFDKPDYKGSLRGENESLTGTCGAVTWKVRSIVTGPEVAVGTGCTT